MIHFQEIKTLKTPFAKLTSLTTFSFFLNSTAEHAHAANVFSGKYNYILYTFSPLLPFKIIVKSLSFVAKNGLPFVCCNLTVNRHK